MRRIRIDVEYPDPQPGTLFIHYDALDAANRSNPAYRYATPTVRLAGSGAWQHAAFHTRYDAAFDGRQNGHSDFRLRAKTPILYVPVLPVGTGATRQLFRTAYALAASNGVWTMAVFEITNATFRNSQNGGADFRLEVVPPEMYVRRVTVAREEVQGPGR